MSKEKIESELAKLMDIVPECEGLIAADANGKLIVGQTITDMDDEKIAKACAQILKDSNKLGQDIEKGSVRNTTIELENGYAVLVGSEKMVLIALAGADGRSSLGLLKRNLISITKL
jgi:predicted regulator of Ras-like GTPase activity (Roadblock/LC7/MglB family)